MFAACEAKTGDALAKLVLIALANRADNKGECYPSLARIAQDCETSESSVKRKIVILEAMGLLKRVNRSVEGMKTSNLYQLPDRSQGYIVGSERPIDRSEGAEGRVTVTHGDRSERPIKHPIETPIETPSVSRRFTPPTVDEVAAYFSERNADSAEAERFVDFYESKGWVVGKTKMKDWKAAVRNWVRRNQSEKPKNSAELARRNSAAVTTDFQEEDVSWIEKS